MISTRAASCCLSPLLRRCLRMNLTSLQAVFTIGNIFLHQQIIEVVGGEWKVWTF